ncbi:hypothetical protein NP233_g10483 [Leucocoprinus birnbaumii]|uniref:Uncharacterized protein n=1 Tax=Leucocoprinus birnbaumii TaxID=56174 RepID=A0AAD5YRU1_9AGAR|nr:hypothetical protein NP233_g10483 [Leucocoprinus birnbaumii]
MPAPLPLSRQLEELTLIQCSLLPGEHLTFLNCTPGWIRDSGSDNTRPSQNSGSSGSRSLEVEAEGAKWEKLVKNGLILDDLQSEGTGLLPARFRLAVDGVKFAFDVDCESLSRAMQELWRQKVREGLDNIQVDSGGESEYPLYQLFSLYLLPLVHQSIDEEAQEGSSSRLTDSQPTKPQPDQELYHVLFTSHHLVSSTKRRNLQSWSSDLQIAGFAKVGYPGVIYAQGLKDDIEEFVGSVKAMQWKALKVRFMKLLIETQDEDATLGGDLIIRLSACLLCSTDQLRFPILADYFDESVELDLKEGRVVVLEEEEANKKGRFVKSEETNLEYFESICSTAANALPYGNNTPLLVSTSTLSAAAVDYSQLAYKVKKTMRVFRTV